MGTNTELYAQDFFEWTQTTATLLRSNLLDAIDLEALAEEIESVGRSQKRELGNRLEVLVMHLLKWRYQPKGRDDSHSWYDTIIEQRGQLQDLLIDSPSLQLQVFDLLIHRYPRARQRAIGETRLSAAAFPDACPWTAEQVLDDDFWPEKSSTENIEEQKAPTPRIILDE